MTPSLDDFRSVKRLHPGMCLLFRHGNEYRAFEEDAELLSRLFGSGWDRYTLTYVALNADLLDEYTAKLTHAGYLVAVHNGGTVTRVRLPGERKPGESITDMVQVRSVAREGQE